MVLDGHVQGIFGIAFSPNGYVNAGWDLACEHI
jgi:hypothetical protein